MEYGDRMGGEVKRMEIREVPAGSRPYLSGKSETLVFRPRLATSPRLTGMFAQKIDAQHPTIQHHQVAPAKEPGRVGVTNPPPQSPPPSARAPLIEPTGEFRELARISEDRRSDTLAPYFAPPPKPISRTPFLPVPGAPGTNGRGFLPRTYKMPEKPISPQPAQ